MNRVSCYSATVLTRGMLSYLALKYRTKHLSCLESNAFTGKRTLQFIKNNLNQFLSHNHLILCMLIQQKVIIILFLRSTHNTIIFYFSQL